MLRHLLFWPVTGPSFLTRFSLDSIHEMLQSELTDDEPVKAALLELQLRLELGEIDDAHYREQEAVLMERLREVRRWREEFGMGIAGGPVRVAGSDVAPEGASSAPAPSEGILPDGEPEAPLRTHEDDPPA